MFRGRMTPLPGKPGPRFITSTPRLFRVAYSNLEALCFGEDVDCDGLDDFRAGARLDQETEEDRERSEPTIL